MAKNGEIGVLFANEELAGGGTSALRDERGVVVVHCCGGWWCGLSAGTARGVSWR